MTRRNTLLTLVAAMGLGAAMLLPSLAHGAPPTNPPLITDPAGDVGVFCGVQVTVLGVTPRCGREIPQPAVPAIDIVQGDLSLASTSLVWETTVVDLDDPSADPDDTAAFQMTAVTGNVTIRVDASRSFRQEPPFASFTVTNTVTTRALTGPAAVAFDNTGNTVRWTVGLTPLNEAIVHVCPACRELRRGSTLSRIEARTTYSRPPFVAYESDHAAASRSYTVGDD